MIRKESRIINDKKVELFFDTDRQAYQVAEDAMNLFLENTRKLKRYEYAEEQGLLLMLPVTIGSIVYSVTRDFISEYTVCNIEKYKEGFFFNWVCEKGIYINVRGFTSHDIGKTVFLTKIEAEAALQAMQEDKQ